MRSPSRNSAARLAAAALVDNRDVVRDPEGAAERARDAADDKAGDRRAVEAMRAHFQLELAAAEQPLTTGVAGRIERIAVAGAAFHLHPIGGHCFGAGEAAVVLKRRQWQEPDIGVAFKNIRRDLQQVDRVRGGCDRGTGFAP